MKVITCLALKPFIITAREKSRRHVLVSFKVYWKKFLNTTVQDKNLNKPLAGQSFQRMEDIFLNSVNKWYLSLITPFKIGSFEVVFFFDYV